MMKRFLVLSSVALALSGCVGADTIEITTQPVKNASVFSSAKTLIADRMRDPEATRFKPEYAVYNTSAGDYIVCGTVNAKNAMGGYVGYTPFYARIRNNAIAILKLASGDEDRAATEAFVIDACSDAASGKMMVSS
jgi:hypothetical protein